MELTSLQFMLREASGDISSEDLLKIFSSEVIDLDNIADLTKHKNAVVVFMGAGDILSTKMHMKITLIKNLKSKKGLISCYYKNNQSLLLFSV